MTEELNNDEISLKELILLLKSYALELLKYWWIIIILGPLFGLLMYLYETTKEITYTSELTFMMDDDSSSSLGGMASLLGNFGFGGGGGSGNIDKMIRLMKSRNSIKKSLFKKTSINGNDDYLVNHIMRMQEIEFFVDELETERFFFKNTSFNRFDTLENSALLGVYKFIAGSKDAKGAVNISYDEISGVINIESTFLSEDLAVEYPRILFNVVEEYYIKNAIEKNQSTHDIITAKHDSIVGLISSKEYQLAQEMDSKRNQILITKRLSQARLEKDIRILYEQFAEVVKNKELSEFSVLSITPVIQPIDLPIYPLEPEEPSYIKAIGIGGILGGVFAGIFIIFRKIIRDAIKDEKKEAA